MGNPDNEQQNRVHGALSSSVKLASLSHSLEFPKRVVLGELTNSLNAGSDRNSDFRNTHNHKLPLKRKYGGEDTQNTPSVEMIQDSEFGNRKCKRELNMEMNESEESLKQKSNQRLNAEHRCAYSSSIYMHQRSLEVLGYLSFFFFLVLNL